jgi:thioredoxin 1
MIDEIIENGGMLHFTAAWCGPCKALTKTFENNKSKFKKIKRFKVDLDEHQELAKKYNIKSIPTILLFKDGNKEPKRLIGNKTLEELITFIS